MLVLTRKPNQSIVINSNVVLTVLEIDGERVKLGISAPRDISILRQELTEAICRENQEAAQSSRDARSALSALRLVGRRGSADSDT